MTNHGQGRGFKLDRDYLTGKQSRKKRKREKWGNNYNGRHPLANTMTFSERAALSRARRDYEWMKKAGYEVTA